MKPINFIFVLFFLFSSCGKHIAGDAYQASIKDPLSGLTVEVYEGEIQKRIDANSSDIITFKNRKLNVQTVPANYDDVMNDLDFGQSKDIYFKGATHKSGTKEYIDLNLIQSR